MSRFDLNDRVAIVTGAGRGLGAACAAVLAEAGASIVLLGRDLDRLLRAERDLAERFGRPCLALQADVTDPAALDAAAAATLKQFGRIDILVNNAGIVSTGSLLETTTEDWRRVIDTNLTGAWNAIRAFAPAMIAGHRGRIVNIGSVMAIRAAANRGAYCAAKAGLLNLARAAAIELGPSGITVNTICPSVIVTDLNREAIATSGREAYRRLLERVPLGRWGEAEDLAGALLLFASDASAYITGQEITIDGGLTAG